MSGKEKIGQTIETLDEESSTEFNRESNKDGENPKDLPWPDESESKE